MTAILTDLALKATVVLAAACVAGLALRRASAASRHLLWTMAAAALLLLPALQLLLPAWQVRALPAVVTNFTLTSDARGPAAEAGPAAAPAPRAAATRVTAPVAKSPRGIGWIALLWAAGAVLSLARLAVGMVATHRLRRRAQPIGETGGVAVLRSPHATMPMTVGILDPAILLPSDADSWSEERRRIVLSHELAHIRRRDCQVQFMARVAFSLYWFHPLAWWAARQFVREREHASDDLVLAAGFRPSEYAAQLLDVARSFQPAGTLAAAGVAMARRSELEGRLLAILDSNLRRGVVSRAGALTGAACALAMVLPLAAMRPAPGPQDQADAPKVLSEEQLQSSDLVNLRVLATAQMDARLYENAEKLYERALEVSRQRFGENSPEFATALLNLAEAERHVRGKYPEAISHYRQALPIQEATLGPNHPEVAATLLLLARDAQAGKRYDEALQQYQRVLSIRTSAFGASDPRVAEVLLAVASLTNDESLYQRAISVFDSSGKTTRQGAIALELYARYLNEHNRGPEAGPLEARAKMIHEGQVQQIGGRPLPASAQAAAKVGNGVMAPKLLFKTEPAYTEEARVAKLQGMVKLYIEVGTDGVAHNIQLKQGIGLGLDESAADAVSHWRFQPATLSGQPVNVSATVEVNFRML